MCDPNNTNSSSFAIAPPVLAIVCFMLGKVMLSNNNYTMQWIMSSGHSSHTSVRFEQIIMSCLCLSNINVEIPATNIGHLAPNPMSSNNSVYTTCDWPRIHSTLHREDYSLSVWVNFFNVAFISPIMHRNRIINSEAAIKSRYRIGRCRSHRNHSVYVAHHIALAWCIHRMIPASLQWRSFIWMIDLQVLMYMLI